MAEMHKHTEPFFLLGRCSFQVNGQQAQTAPALDPATVIVRDYILTNTAYHPNSLLQHKQFQQTTVKQVPVQQSKH